MQAEFHCIAFKQARCGLLSIQRASHQFSLSPASFCVLAYKRVRVLAMCMPKPPPNSPRPESYRTREKQTACICFLLAAKCIIASALIRDAHFSPGHNSMFFIRASKTVLIIFLKLLFCFNISKSRDINFRAYIKICKNSP